MLSGLTRILGLPMFQVGSPHAGADTPFPGCAMRPTPWFAPCGCGHSYDTNPYANMDMLPDLSAADTTPPSPSSMRQLYRRFNTILDMYPPDVQPDLSCDFMQGWILIDDTTLCFDEDASGMMLARITGPDGTIRTMPVTGSREFQDACHTAISVARPDATPLNADNQTDEETPASRHAPTPPDYDTRPGGWPDPDPAAATLADHDDIRMESDGTLTIHDHTYTIPAADRYRLARQNQYEPDGTAGDYRGTGIRIQADPAAPDRRIVSFPDGSAWNVSRYDCRFDSDCGFEPDGMADILKRRWDDPYSEQQLKYGEYCRRKGFDPTNPPNDAPAATRRAINRYQQAIMEETRQRHTRIREQLDRLRRERENMDQSAHRELTGGDAGQTAEQLANRLCRCATYGDMRSVAGRAARGVDGVQLRGTLQAAIPVMRDMPDLVEVDACDINPAHLRHALAGWLAACQSRDWN